MSTVESIKKWFEKAVPEPIDKNINVQLGCHFEEVAEMLETLEPSSEDDNVTMILLRSALVSVEKLATHLKTSGTPIKVPNNEFARLAMLDAIGDQIVTAIGVAHMLKMDPVLGLAEVKRANWSKFNDGNPIFNEDGKIIKNKATYTPPDLSPYI